MHKRCLEAMSNEYDHDLAVLQRDRLLEALKGMVDLFERTTVDSLGPDNAASRWLNEANAAIAAVAGSAGRVGSGTNGGHVVYAMETE